MKWDVAQLKMYLETLEPILKLVTSLSLKHCSHNTKITNRRRGFFIILQVLLHRQLAKDVN